MLRSIGFLCFLCLIPTFVGVKLIVDGQVFPGIILFGSSLLAHLVGTFVWLSIQEKSSIDSASLDKIDLCFRALYASTFAGGFFLLAGLSYIGTIILVSSLTVCLGSFLYFLSKTGELS